MPDFRRGKQHIEEANKNAQGGGGDFKPFIQNFYWNDGKSYYLLILNPIDDIPMVKMQKVFVDGKPAHLIARTDDAIGERKDPIEDEWDYEPKDNNICMAVSLIPTVQVVNQRQRPTGFEVETRTFERRIRNDAGELTEEREEITTPVVGFIVQSPNNFFNKVASADANIAPIESTPVRITRNGERLDTDYEIEMFEDKPVDLSGLLDFVDGITYLHDEMDELIEQMDEAADDLSAASVIGSMLLDKKLDEMCDEEYYNEVLSKITEPAKFSKKRKEASKGKAKTRDPRQSQRRSRREPQPQMGANEVQDQEPHHSADEQEPVATETVEPKAKSRRPNKDDAPADRISSLRERSEARAKAKAAKAEKAD